MNRTIIWGGGLMMALFLALALVLGWLGLQERAAARALAEYGVAVEATVVGLRSETRTRRTNDRTTTETTHEATYAFEAPVVAGGEAQIQRLERSLPYHVFRDLRVGQVLEIRYLPENPARIDVYPGESSGSATLLFVVTGVFLAAIAFVAGIFGWIATSLRRMAVHGVDRTGRVLAVHAGRSGPVLEIGFNDAAGERQTARVTVSRGSRWAATPVGASVSLRYDPAKPSHVVLAEPAAEAVVPRSLEPAIRSF